MSQPKTITWQATEYKTVNDFIKAVYGDKIIREQREEILAMLDKKAKENKK